MKLCTTNDCQYVITGGVDGEVKLWCIDHQVKKLQSKQKVHTQEVTGLKMVGNDSLASSSLDGSIILWKIQKLQSLMKISHVSISPADGGLLGFVYHQNA
jgi:WD40 repeat protein